jgi:hypothetical protein
MKQLIYEAVVVGIAFVIFGNIAAFLVGPFFKVDLPEECKNWNKFYAMEITLFVAGVLGHLVFEFSGANKWYCKNGFACMR